VSSKEVILGTAKHRSHCAHSTHGKAQGFSTWAQKDFPEGMEFSPNYLPDGEVMIFNEPCSIHVGFLDRIDTRKGPEDKITAVQIDMDHHGDIKGPILWEYAGSIDQKAAKPAPVPVYAWICVFLIPFFAYQYNFEYLPYPTNITGVAFIASILYAFNVAAFVGGRLVHHYQLKKSLRMDTLKFVSPAKDI
jgi:hypothetical protein